MDSLSKFGEEKRNMWRDMPLKEKQSIVRQLAGNKITDIDLEVFIAQTERCNLDPLVGEIWLYPQGARHIGVVSYKEYIKRGEAGGRIEWWDADELVSLPYRGAEETAAVFKIKFTDSPQVRRWTVFEKEASASSFIWRKWPLFMLRKVAISQAFRIYCARETGELPYSSDELSLSDVPEDSVHETIKAGISKHAKPKEGQDSRA